MAENLQEWYQALSRADAAAQAGDTSAAEDARQLAQAIDRMEKAISAPQSEAVPRLSGGVDGKSYGLPEGYEVLGTFGDGGLVFKSPDGSLGAKSKGGTTNDPETVEKIRAGKDFAQNMTDRIDNEWIDKYPVAARANKVIEGAPMLGEWMDEGMSLASRGIQSGGEMLGFDMSDMPDMGANMHRASVAMERQKPIESAALQTAGGVVFGAPMAVGASGVPIVGNLIDKAASLPRWGRVATGALAGLFGGALEGAVSGAGRQGADGAQRGSNAKWGALVGGGLGAILGALGPVFGDGVKGAWNYLKGTDVSKIADDLGIGKEAARLIRDEMDGLNFDEAVKRLELAGDDAMIGEAAAPLSGILDAAGVAGGQSSQIVQDAVSGRMARAGDEMTTALDAGLGRPMNVEEVKAGIMSGTQGERSDLYNKANAVEIDWRSPAGEEIATNILPRVPREVMADVRAEEATRYRPQNRVPDSAYPEMADKGAVSTGATQRWVDAEEAEIKAFFDAVKAEESQAKAMKRPVTDWLKKQGGVDPNGWVASELRHRGITTNSHPALFKRGGVKDLDNLPISEHGGTEGFASRFRDDGNGYVDQNSIIDALADEDMIARQGGRSSFDPRDVDEYTARQVELDRIKGLPDAPPAPDGEAVPRWTVEQLDAIKRSLQTSARKNVLPDTRTMTPVGNNLDDLARRLRDALIDISPDYSKAIKAGGDAIERREAADLGADLLNDKVSRYEFAKGLRRMSAQGRADAKTAARGVIDEIAARAKKAMSDPLNASKDDMAAWQSLSSQAAREKLSMLSGRDFSKMAEKLDRYGYALQLRKDTAINSKTEPRSRFRDNVRGAARGGPLRSMARGEPFAASREAIQAATGENIDSVRQRELSIYADVAKALTGKRGKDAQDALRIVEAAIKYEKPLSGARSERVDDVLRSLGFVGLTEATRQTRGD